MLTRQMFMIADRCNLSCTYCYFETGEYQYRPVQAGAEDYDRWLTACAEEQPVRAVSFTGGEPLLRPDLLDLVEIARHHSENVLVLTNAVRMTDETAAELARLRCNVDVSIDHVSSELADQVRGGTKASLAGIKRLATAGVRLQVVMVITSLNWKDTEQVVSAATEQGWAIELILVSVPAHHPLSVLSLSASERRELSSVLTRWDKALGRREYYERLRYFLATGRIPQVRTCATGEEGVFVNPDGDIMVCGHRGLPPLGNIKRSTPREVLERKRRALRVAPAGPCASLGCLSITT
jgi:MoaA/NifB/PqqE/SkfB family radical SAM enzyme